jgi:heme/copper-type cytochrome/quinol oxidase subunit 3
MTTEAMHADYPALHRYGLWLFIASEAFLFGILLAIRFILVGTETPEAVNLALGVILTVILLSTSYFAHRAEAAMSEGRMSGVVTQLGVVLVLGIVFLVIVGFEWSVGFEEFPVSTLYGSAFFLITGTHALHLFSGLLVLGSLAIQAKRGTLTSDNSWKLGAGIKYWHFVDVIWLTVFVTLYLV